MSNFFDKLNATLTNTGRTVSQKVKNSSDASKLMNEITMENKNIQANLNAIGKLYYDICKDNPDDGFREMVEAITRSEQRIAELQESIKIIRAREPELVPVPEDIQNYTAPQARPASMVCMGCGNTYPEGSAFCAVCGQKLVPQYQSAAAAASAPVQTAEDVQVKPEEPVIEAETIITDAQLVEEPAQEAEAEDVHFCPYCGKKITLAGQTFCDNCGHAI